MVDDAFSISLLNRASVETVKIVPQIFAQIAHYGNGSGSQNFANKRRVSVKLNQCYGMIFALRREPSTINKSLIK